MKTPYTELASLGLSPLAISCYASLRIHGSTDVKQLADRLGRRASSLYPVLKQLQTYGFVSRFKADIGPTYYTALFLEDVIDTFFAYQRRQVLPIIREQRQRRPVPLT